MNWNLGHLRFTTEKPSKFWQISLAGVKVYYFCSKLGSKKLNHAATGDLKSGGRGVKRGSWPPDIPVPPFQVSVPSLVLVQLGYKLQMELKKTFVICHLLKIAQKFMKTEKKSKLFISFLYSQLLKVGNIFLLFEGYLQKIALDLWKLKKKKVKILKLSSRGHISLWNLEKNANCLRITNNLLKMSQTLTEKQAIYWR